MEESDQIIFSSSIMEKSNQQYTSCDSFCPKKAQFGNTVSLLYLFEAKLLLFVHLLVEG
jgi:hypothetical protein